MNLSSMSSKFDFLGFPAFIYILVIGILVYLDFNVPRWMLLILILISSIGAIIDGIIVFEQLKKRKK